MDIKKYEVPVSKLRWECDPNIFEFNHTKNLAPLREFVGQDRAIRAIEFGLSMDREGYNIYVAGLTGTGKTTMVKTYIQRLVERKKVEEKRQLRDYLNNQGVVLTSIARLPDNVKALIVAAARVKSAAERVAEEEA